MIEHCAHCGGEIRPTRKLSQWMTAWLHVYSGYNHCNPDYTSGNENRAEPADQMILEIA